MSREYFGYYLMHVEQSWAKLFNHTPLTAQPPKVSSHIV